MEMRPPDVTDETYDRVAIEDFGKGMLLGMGWKPGQAIGGSNKALVEPIEFIPRGGRMGLGATVGKLTARPKKYLKPGEKEPEGPMRVAPGADGKVRHFRKLSERLIPVHSMQLKIGKLVEVMTGPHRRLYGKCVNVGPIPDDPDDQPCTIKLNISQAEVKFRKGELQVLDEHALPKDHPAFSTKPPKQPKMLGLGSLEALTKKRKRDDEDEKGVQDKKEKDKERDRDRERDRERDRDRDRVSKISSKSSSKAKRKEEKITWLVKCFLISNHSYLFPHSQSQSNYPNSRPVLSLICRCRV